MRGVNLGGSSKVPRTPDGPTWNQQGFFDHRHISFIGRPFPLEEADEHFSRLNKWGLTFLRFLVTWEAIEHAGPGLYDEAYLDYLYTVVQKAAEYDIHLFIDPIRMCGAVSLAEMAHPVGPLKPSAWISPSSKPRAQPSHTRSMATLIRAWFGPATTQNSPVLPCSRSSSPGMTSRPA